MHKAGTEVSDATHKAAPGLEALARFGYASKGLVYGMVGMLALSVALGRGGATTDSQGALIRLQDLPGGTILMWLLVLGLIGYALWQMVRAFLDPERQGKEAKGIVKRIGYFLSGLVNLGLALFAARLAMRGSASRNQQSEAQAAGDVLALPGGQLLLGLAGLVLLAVAGNQLYSAAGAKFMKRMKFSGSAGHGEKLKRIGQIGIGARGITLGIIGVFLLVAAWRNKAGMVPGVSEVLTWLNQQPAGNFLLGVLALGTLCYGVWCGVQALYRRIRVEGSAA
ncbi:Conserved hypothetical protein; putative membrane protein [Deinococcus deserti VCD115]|uniref:DUF1206 domain-containing protein n=2 Tax=Deinococcus TaxID=1298 RepID=C1CY55_DEIDV|nr:Conserved hypothetical protein; putative membrane protein [Deinococcus deserti VCD115]